MTDKAKNHVQSMLKAAAAKDGAGFKVAFDKAMTQRVGGALEQTRQEIAQNTFGGIKEGTTKADQERADGLAWNRLSEPEKSRRAARAAKKVQRIRGAPQKDKRPIQEAATRTKRLKAYIETLSGEEKKYANAVWEWLAGDGDEPDLEDFPSIPNRRSNAIEEKLNTFSEYEDDPRPEKRYE